MDRGAGHGSVPRSSTLVGLLRAASLVGLVALIACVRGCIEDLDTSRNSSVRGSVGEEMFGVICDRVGAQALREDLSGASFRDVCHRPFGGSYAAKVDTTKLPALDPNAVDERGQPVGLEKQTKDRARAIGRIEALARRRSDLVLAFDATFPQEKIAIKDLDHPDETRSCDAPRASGEGLLADQVADMLGRMTELYHDGTLPQSTQSLGHLVEAFERSEEAQAAWSRISSRQGYRPVETGLGVARPVVAYPRLRELSDSTLRLLAADSKPYELDPKRDATGARVPVPGAGNAAFAKLLEVAHAELLGTRADEPLPPLTVTFDPGTGRSIPSRPRDNLELVKEVFFTTDDTFSTGTPRWIVRRDRRGYAAVTGPALGLFADADQDGLPDVDEAGRLQAAGGALAPSPFPHGGRSDAASRDELGRALTGDTPLYDYLDTNRTFAARLLQDLRPLVNPDPAAQHETLMDLAAGLYVIGGPRVKAERRYPSGAVGYDAISPASPLLDLVHAFGPLLGDKSSDATLALVRDLFANHPGELARVVGALIEAQEIAKTHDEARTPPETTFWDDALEIAGKVARNPALLRDVIEALGDPASANLGVVLAKDLQFRDTITYDVNDLNGSPWNATTKTKGEMSTPVDRDAPRTRKNRSALMRVLQLLSDTKGVTVCNKAEARLHAKKTLLGQEVDITMPLSIPPGSGSYPECAVFKIDDLAVFYVDTIANANETRKNDPRDRTPPGAIYVRDDALRNGLVGDLGAATVETMEQSSRIHGFWTPPSSKILAAKPEWLNRLAYVDFDGDTVNLQTKKHVEGLTGRFLGASVCPERVIDDPKPNALDANPDKKIRLRACSDGQWFQQRNDNTLFLLEQFGFYDAIRPLLRAFVRHRAEDLFLDLAKAAYKYWPDEGASAGECQLPGGTCTRQGLVSYEPLLAEQLITDIVPALHELVKVLRTIQVRRCEELAVNGTCTEAGVRTMTGIDVLVETARTMLDPEYAKATLALTDRRGHAGARKNDGSPIPQVTPAHLVTDALTAIDRAFATYDAEHPADQGRHATFRRARSQLVDQLLAVDGAKTSASFRNPAVVKIVPVIVDMLRAQLAARCPRSFSPPHEACTWARVELTDKATATLTGPLASTGLELLEVIRRDPEARRETGLLLQYLLDSASSHDALANVLASTSDVLQALQDERNVVPLLHVFATALEASSKDGEGRVVQKGLVDAQMALLARLSGRYFDREGREICKREIDPNQVLTRALAKLVTPIEQGAIQGQSPLEVIIDVVADVNRVDATRPYDGVLERGDYANVSDNVVSFLLDPERGLEQFYEVIRRGTKP